MHCTNFPHKGQSRLEQPTSLWPEWEKVIQVCRYVFFSDILISQTPSHRWRTANHCATDSFQRWRIELSQFSHFPGKNRHGETTNRRGQNCLKMAHGYESSTRWVRVLSKRASQSGNECGGARDEMKKWQRSETSQWIARSSEWWLKLLARGRISYPYQSYFKGRGRYWLHFSFRWVISE